MHWPSSVIALRENEKMIVVEVNVFLEVCFDDWCVHSSRIKILRDPEHTFQRETKTEKRKEKAYHYGWQGSKARSNGINEGMCDGMCFMPEVLALRLCDGLERPA